MNVLAFDTCFDACSAAVARGDGLAVRRLFHRSEPMQTGHAEALMPMIEQVMDEAELRFEDVDRLAVTTGPGTFTGTRITVAAARALALALAVPVVGFSSLWAIGVAAGRRLPDFGGPSDAVLVARDARRDEVYVEVTAADGSSLTGPCLVSPSAAARLCADRRLFIVGSGAEPVAAAARSLGRDAICGFEDLFCNDRLQPDAAILAEFAASAEPLDASPRPLYLRAADAKPQSAGVLPRATS